MQRLLAFFLLMALTGPLAHAQLDSMDKKTVDQAAFKLIKSTVEFIATDKVKFPNLSRPTCDDCTDYTSLIKFIVDNKLQKADELVRDARQQVRSLSTPSATAGQILTGLKQYLSNKATKGGNRERRTKLPSYADYTTRVAKILADSDVKTEGLQTPAAENLPALTDTVYPGESVAMAAPVKQSDAGGLFSLGGLALLLTLLNGAGLVYLWLQRGKKTESMADTQLPELSRRVIVLEQERQKLLDRISLIEKGPATLESHPTTTPASSTSALAPEPQRPEQAISPAQQPEEPALHAPKSVSQASVQAVRSNQLRRQDLVLYGRTADLGDGFSVASLLTSPERDTVFQIEVRTDFQAIYRVTEESGAQQLALSDPYSYLADACEYMAKPILNARIRTYQPGQLALQGDKWKIIEKAKISFY